MTARGYEFYLRVFNSISHEKAQRTSEISSHTNDDNFPKILDHFPKISEDFQTCC